VIIILKDLNIINNINKETIERLADDLSTDKEKMIEAYKSNSGINKKISAKNENTNGNKIGLKANFLNHEQSSASNNPIMKHITPSDLLNNRKFSILEIQGADSLSNFRELIGIR